MANVVICPERNFILIFFLKKYCKHECSKNTLGR